MNNELDFILKRRSVLAGNLTGPGPNADQIQMILNAGARVPDHGKLAPWRFILFEGEARAAFGEKLAAVVLKNEPDANETRIECEKKRFERAPLIIAVVSSVIISPKVPDWEQVLSAGAVCQNILHAANALGFSAQWLTEWYAFDEQVREEMGIFANEQVAGFIYIGTAKEPPKERQRPEVAKLTTHWQPK